MITIVIMTTIAVPGETLLPKTPLTTTIIKEMVLAKTKETSMAAAAKMIILMID